MKKLNHILAVLCRLLFGAVFLFSGFVKAVDPMGTAIKITDYLTAFSLEGLTGFALPLAFLLITAEFVIGFNLFFGVHLKKTAWLALVFMLVMTPITLYLAIANPVSDCGCFGDAIVLTNWQTFWKNVVLDIILLILLLTMKGEYPWLSEWASWVVMVIPVGVVLGIGLHSYRHLPMLDFRPYKIGNSIKEGMSVPEGAPTDEYKVSFIYEKDGVKQEFTMEDYPWNDSTWVFVEQKSELVKKGYVPPIHDFTMETPDGEDITEDILDRDGYTLLVICPKLEKADTKHWKALEALRKSVSRNGIPMIGMTSSYTTEVEKYCRANRIQIPFVATDEITLKTIVRSNPGLVLLKGDVVTAKWHYNDFPTSDELNAIIKK